MYIYWFTVKRLKVIFKSLLLRKQEMHSTEGCNLLTALSSKSDASLLTGTSRNKWSVLIMEQFKESSHSSPPLSSSYTNLTNHALSPTFPYCEWRPNRGGHGASITAGWQAILFFAFWYLLDKHKFSRSFEVKWMLKLLQKHLLSLWKLPLVQHSGEVLKCHDL